MGRRSLFGQIFIVICAVIVALAVSLVAFTYQPFSSYLWNRISRELLGQTRMAKVAMLAQGNFVSNINSTNQLLSNLAKASQVRLSLINEAGEVTFDSAISTAQLDSHIDRPEVAQALVEGEGFSIRRSRSLDRELMYWAVAVDEADTQKWVLRGAKATSEIKSIVLNWYLKFIFCIFLAFFALALVMRFFSRRTRNALSFITKQMGRLAEGEFGGRVNFNENDIQETQKLAQAINDTSVRLSQQFEFVVNQKNERDSIISSMVEGVLAVDPKERIVHLNRAAANILGFTSAQAVGMSIQEVVRIPELQKVVQQALFKEFPTEHDLSVFVKDKEKTLHIKTSPLRSAGNKNLGVVLVFSDITKLRLLETHRRDFVANVSHELRTPLTSIRGFSETLLNNEVPAAESKKFLEVIHRHANRLGEIIDDLLALSKLERENEFDAIELSHELVWPSLVAAKEMCEVKAASFDVKIILKGDSGLKAKINSQLLEQAIVNLIDNAIKYSEKGSQVIVNLSARSNEIVISVTDTGAGIEKEHLPRLFERFYRIDKARSRQLGGTGLGLSIVKHVSLAHRGKVDVVSELGKGSTFSIILPKIDRESHRILTESN